MARAPSNDSDSGIDGLPTAHVAVRPTPINIPAPYAIPVATHPLAVTPAPLSGLRFPQSEWSGNDEFETPSSRRAPRIGDTIFGFKLIGELGRGAFARVYLAEQEALANRPVALKVTLRPTREAERLARLQHTNIVPVYSVHDEGSVQVICMPFLGRVTIADLIRAFRVDHPSRHSGRKSTSARAIRSTSLDSKHKSNLPFGSDSKSGKSRVPTWTWAAEEQPPIVGDPIAVLQAVMQLAEGLSHAHERGILHLDLKPANVLLADTGEPMLLDFNLSFDAASPARELVGGTMPYMAIEQLVDMRQRGKGEIDQRTDIYSLGAMAFEMLTGTVPFRATTAQMRDFDAMIAARRQGPPSIRELNPGVTPAVETIVRKMLAPEPADRYQSTDELRQDIQRHLNDQPLKYARETSLRERFGKWRRRNPRLPLRLFAASLIGLTLGLGGVAYHRAEANANVAAAKQAENIHASLDTLRLDLILPGDPKARARGVQRASELLAAYGLPGDVEWQKRPEAHRLSDEERATLAGDVGEVMALLAQAKWREAVARPESDRRELVAEAWQLNRAARTCFSAETVPPFLNQQAATIAPAAGEVFSVVDTAKPPANTRDCFLNAISLMTSGHYIAAAKLFDHVTTTQPNHAAAHFCLAYCRQQKGENESSLERYDMARVLLPQDPRPNFYRGMIYVLTKKPNLAEEEFTKVLALDSDYADAYRHRAVARLRMTTCETFMKKTDAVARAKKLQQAEADLTAALKRGAPAICIHSVRAEVRERRGNYHGAAADREASDRAVLNTEEGFIARGWSRIDRDPAAAAADFRKAIDMNSRSIVALHNLAHIYTDKLKDNAMALIFFNQLVEIYPEYAPAAAGRAVVFARLGQRDEARKEIERARLLSAEAEIVYQAASVYSLTAENEKDQSKAVALLRESFQKGYVDLKKMANDADLNPIRGNAEFEQISRAAATIYSK